MVTMYKCVHVDSQSVCYEIILHLYASTPDGTCTMCPSSADQTRAFYDDDALGDKCECNNAMMSIAMMCIMMVKVFIVGIHMNVRKELVYRSFLGGNSPCEPTTVQYHLKLRVCWCRCRW